MGVSGCPVERTAAILSGKWTTLIVRDLLEGPRRFGELRGPLQGVWGLFGDGFAQPPVNYMATLPGAGGYGRPAVGSGLGGGLLPMGFGLGGGLLQPGFGFGGGCPQPGCIDGRCPKNQ